MGMMIGGAMVLAAAPAHYAIGADATAVDPAASVREYEIVPCLLPARIRKLGRMTYPGRRRLIETQANKCELRGGEYTFYDRGQPDSAALFFKKLADDGDVDAQVSLGDVYQYLYAPPNYGKAVEWYEKAAAADNAKAKMQLARLYERGLGVEKDGLKAVNLWREATGAGENLVLASELEAVRTEAGTRIERLTAQLRQRNEEAAEVRRQLADARESLRLERWTQREAEAELSVLRKKLAAQLASAGDPEEIARLRAQVASQQQTIDDQAFKIDSMESDYGVQEAQLAANLRQVEAQNRRLESELAKVSTASDDELAEALTTLEERDAQIASLSAELREARSAIAAAEAAAKSGEETAQVSQTEQAEKVKQLEWQLAQVVAEAETLRGNLATQVRETNQAQARFAQTEAELSRVKLQAETAASALREAQDDLQALMAERDQLENTLAAAPSGGGADTAQLEKQIQRQETLLEQQSATIDRLQADVARYSAELNEINVRRKSYVTRTPMEDTSGVKLPRNVKIGKFHALVIGNNDYQFLNDLENAQNDAKEMHTTLRSDYGFNSNLVLDASRLDMYQAVAGLIEQAQEDDLVLIYYAGHGFSVADQSYWLPVDVRSRQEAPGTGLSSETMANWIKNIKARHVMIIADSCYSGAGIETRGGFKHDAEELEGLLPFLLASRSRTMITSGGDAPVMDGGGEGQHSVFTRELLGILKENRGVMHSEALYTYLLERVKFTSDGTEVNQTPTFGSIERAGHESGQFVFVHRGMRS